MNCAPHRAEGWNRHLDRLLLSDTEQFLPAPIPILLNRAGAGDIRLPSFGVELRLLINHNAVGNPTFLTPQPTPQPWILGDALWSLTGNNSAKKVNGSTATLSIAGACVATKIYVVTFTIANRVSGSITARLGAGTAGTVRSANGTFVESLTCGAGTTFELIPEAGADLAGEIKDVSVVPNTAPGDLTLKLYQAPDALAANRSSSAWSTTVLSTSTIALFNLGLWKQYWETGSGLDLGLDLAAAYADGKIFGSVWSRRYWWGNPARAT